MTTFDDFHLDGWIVSPKTNCIRSNQTLIQIEPRLMDVLVYLCQHQNQVVDTNELIENCWPNQYISDNPVHKCIAQLRKALSDDARNPKFIKTWPKKGYSIIAPVRGLTKKTPQTTAIWISGSPFPGLDSYGPDESSVFFGRSKAISEIKYQINQLCNHDFSFLWIMGSRGVGKTSLMQAAILPYLNDPDYPFQTRFKSVLNFEIPSQERPLQAFIQYLKQQNILDTLPSDQQLIEAALKNPDQITDYFQKTQSRESLKNKVVLFIDQLERLFFSIKQLDDDLDVFLLILQQLVNSKQFILIVALQNEYYAQIMQSDVYLSMKGEISQYDLLPPEPSELVDIIKKPVAAAGLSFEFDSSTFRSLDEQIISDMRLKGNVLPLLNHTLRELCLQTNNDKQLTFKAYENMGGLTGSVAYKADEFFEQCNEHQISAFKSKLHHLIQFGHNPENKLYCAKADISCFDDALSQQVIEHLLEAKLLHSEIFEGKTYVSIIHESLLDQCLLFKSWISRNQLRLSLSKEIKNRANHWHKNNCHSNYLLYNDSLLNQTKSLISENDFNFNSQETNFIKASVIKQKRKSLMKHMALATMVILLVSSSILLVKFKNLNQQLNQSHEKAENLIGYMIDELKGKLKAVGKLELLGSIGQQVITYYGNNPQLTTHLQSTSHRIEALNTLGEVKIKQGELVSAENYFQEAKLQYQQYLKESPLATNLLFKISQSNYWLGYLAYLQKDMTKTEQFWHEYLSNSEQLVSIEGDNTQWQLELSYALNNLGTLHYNQQHYDQASHYINQSADLKNTLLLLEPNNKQFMAELADTLSWQASIADKTHQLKVAKEIHQQSLQLAQRLFDLEPENQIWKHRLAQAHYRLALKNYDMAMLPDAKSEINNALQLFQQLHEVDNSNQAWIRELANSHLLLAKIYKHNQQLDDANLNINLALKHTENYSDESQILNSSLIQNLVLVAESSLILLQLEQPKAALSQFEKTAARFKKLNQLKASEKTYYEAYADYVLGQIQIANNLLILGNNSFTEALNTIEKNTHQQIKDKKSMALAILITKQMADKTADKEMVDFLSQVNYKNPDFN